MVFFDKQDNARRRTVWLVAAFGFSVFCIVAALHLAATRALDLPLFEPGVFAGIAAGVLAFVVIGWALKTRELASGGPAVASMLGGRLVPAASEAPGDRRLLNVVEEMSLASGVPVPLVYVLPERGINAFAAGFSTSDAVVGVTQGALDSLSREELQGVVGHEFSHILNGDMRLNVHLIGWLHGIFFIAATGGLLARIGLQSGGGRRGSKNNNSLPALLVLCGAGLYLTGWIGVFFGRLIQAAVSRQREYLADASAVQFTRNPGGLAGALKKLLTEGSRIEAGRAREAGHLFFGEALRAGWFAMFATHPPLDRRIREILHAAIESPKATRAPQPPPLPESIAVSSSLDARRRDPLGAEGVVFGLLLARDETVREHQLAQLPDTPGLRDLALQTCVEAVHLPAAKKIALVELALPSLRMLSPGQAEDFCKHMESLISADSRVEIFEWALRDLVLRHLRESRKPRRIRTRTPATEADAMAVGALLAAVDGNSGSLQALCKRFAWDTPPGEADWAKTSVALERLASAPEEWKRMFVAGLIDSLGPVPKDDTQALLRVVADALGQRLDFSP